MEAYGALLLLREPGDDGGGGLLGIGDFQMIESSGGLVACADHFGGRFAFTSEPQRTGGREGKHAREVMVFGPSREKVGMVEAVDVGESESLGIDGAKIDNLSGLSAGCGRPMARPFDSDEMYGTGIPLVLSNELDQRENIV